MFDRNSSIGMSEGLNDIHNLHPNGSGFEDSTMTERQRKVLKTELKNLRVVIVDSLAGNSLEEIMQTVLLLAYFKCDPIYKYPSFDFVPMLCYCFVVSFLSLHWI